MDRRKQIPLFDQPAWAEHWSGMPAYDHEDLESWRSIVVHFRDGADRLAFADLIGQPIGQNQKSLWYPAADIGRYRDKLFVSKSALVPRYPIYVISKGRWESRKTARALEKMSIPYRIVVEPQELEEYARVIAPDKILVLPFSNLGQGSIPARNWVWEYSISEGHKRHWILDDNIPSFHRFQGNLKVPCGDGAIFCASEDFTDRYENVLLSGFNYFKFVTRKSDRIPPFVTNTRIYSCILIQNDSPLRWRGRYNEDTDLSLRVLKAGFCTILFNAFLCDKTTTLKMRGGNTDELYQDDGRLQMAESLRDQHPDVVTVVRKFGRWQHQVDYRKFRRNNLILKAGAEVSQGLNEYGMALALQTEAR